MVDSGIIAERGNRLEFWHLSFQEYLAAYEIAGLLEKDQHKVIFQKDRIYSSEWRELLFLLGGILHKQSSVKVNHFIDAIIKDAPKAKTHDMLPHLAKIVGVMGQ